jgi:ferritin-like metal-binding protein YciE
MQLNTLKEALEMELADLYDAEQQLVQWLPKLAQSASNPTLRSVMEDHVEETKNQITRLEKAFELMGRRPKAETCDAMKGLLREADAVVSTSGDKAVKDAVLIGALQRVEHYEIAAYGTARTFADRLELDDVSELLEETLDEESSADERLSELAEGGFFSEGVNAQAGRTSPPPR